MFGLFRQKQKGCLHGKTIKEKISFFQRLKDFATVDEVFFKEQYNDLLPHEQKEFCDWVIKGTQEIKRTKELLNAIEILLHEKYKK